MRMPVLFISHGSPEIAVRETPAHLFLKSLGPMLPKPEAILVVSAHWETAGPVVATSAMPETIYDFGDRFDPRLWDIAYDAPGASALVQRAAKLIAERIGDDVAEDPSRGRDHGVWTPLHLMFPGREVPVSQVSIQPSQSPMHHHAIGQALTPLRDEGVLIVASGAITHNLSEFRGRTVDAAEPDWVAAFRNWMKLHLEAGDRAALLDYRAQAPFAEKNHPEDEHLLPIFAALGAAADGEPIVRLHDSVEHGVIGMDVYRFGSATRN